MAVISTGGKSAVTHFTVERRFGDKAALVICQLETGRTHQIRVHMAHIGHPLIGDPVYGRGRSGINFPRQALHAAVLGFKHPRAGNELAFEAALPDDMADLRGELQKLD